MTGRRDFVLGAGLAGAALAAFPPVIRRALAIPARRRTGSLLDVEHVVILTQENRSFDHHFGTLSGVRGFADRFPIPVQGAQGDQGKTVWYQTNAEGKEVAPFHLDTAADFAVMRVSGTPHLWPDAQAAWGEGRLDAWPTHKRDHSMGYYARADLPFQFALAEAFTLCDAYHCALHGGTNPNRVFLWTGTNDPGGRGGGPVLNNAYDSLEHDPSGGYTWLTYCERLQKAGVTWQIYQDMDDNFTDNPVAGFRSFRASRAREPGSTPALAAHGLRTRDLDLLRDDVLDGRLPQVSWIVATAEGSEHPGPSSPAQGAEYIARVLDALTADPEVWARTVLLVNFDENDGFFDHMPPPAAPSYTHWHEDPRRAELAGASTVDTTGEYHERLAPGVDPAVQQPLHRPYGLGPRVPMYVISPWSTGGWVCSEVFDHTSVIRFLERRFGVHEPNISAWRRAVCGDLTSAFNFARLDSGEFYERLPDTQELAERARTLVDTKTPEAPSALVLPLQERGVRPSRALPYELTVRATLALEPARITLDFASSGTRAAVFHVYDRLHLDRVPRRYTVEPRRTLRGSWQLEADGGAYDLWVLGPNGFHRHFTGLVSLRGRAPEPELMVDYVPGAGLLTASVVNRSTAPCEVLITPNAYGRDRLWQLTLPPRATRANHWPLHASGFWYDFTATAPALPGFARRFAGRLETGRDSYSDPALGGVAL
jgi:phospholipase C